jgi:hypothetical protein
MASFESSLQSVLTSRIINILFGHFDLHQPSLDYQLPNTKEELEVGDIDQIISELLAELTPEFWEKVSVEELMKNGHLTFRDIYLPCEIEQCWCQLLPDKARKEIHHLYKFKEFNLWICEVGFNDKTKDLTCNIHDENSKVQRYLDKTYDMIRDAVREAGYVI